MTTAILMTYKRPDLLLKQIESVKPQVDEIIITHEQNERTGEFNLYLGDKLIKYHTSQSHLKQKFWSALSAETKYVAILDDDIIPDSNWIQTCLELISPGLILGSWGVILREKKYSSRRVIKNNNKLIHVDMIGHSWFMPVEYISHIFEERIPDYCRYADDLWVAYRMQQAGISMYVTPGGNINKPQVDDVAVSSRKEHMNERNNIINRLIDKGWELLYV